MKALAYHNYLSDEKGYLCCACVEQDLQDQEEHGFPFLFFTTTKPVKVDGNVKCVQCGHSVGGHAAGCAAERIAEKLDAANQS